MNSYTLCLLAHLTGLTLMAGTNIVEFVAFRSIARTYQSDSVAAIHQISLLSKLSVLLIIGGILLVLSGIGLLVVTHNAFGGQLWFKIKMAFVVGLVLNGFLTGLKSEKRLKRGVNMENALRGMVRFYFIQLCLFFFVVVMAVFKFN